MILIRFKSNNYLMNRLILKVFVVIIVLRGLKAVEEDVSPKCSEPNRSNDELYGKIKTDHCDESNSVLPFGIRQFKLREKGIILNIFFGKDNARIRQLRKRNYKISLICLLDGCQLNPSSINGTICNFEGLKSNQNYSIAWSVYAFNATAFCKSETQNAIMKTRGERAMRKVPSVTVSKPLKTSADLHYNNNKNDFQSFSYNIQWRPLSCMDDSYWMNFTGWKLTEANNVNLNLKDFPYSELTVRYSFLYQNKKETPESATKAWNATYIGVPDNELLDIQCLPNEYCSVTVENNCYKQNGPDVIIKYVIKLTNEANVTFKKFNGTVPQIKGNLSLIDQINDDYDSSIDCKLDLPSALYNYTEYKVSFTPSNIEGRKNKEHMKEITFRTKPSVPNELQDVSFVVSHTTVILFWRNPPDFPPTGELESFFIKTITPKREFSKTIEPRKDDGWYSHKFEKLPEINLFRIFIDAKNYNVTMTTRKYISATTNDRPLYPEKFEFLNISETKFIIKVDKPLEVRGDKYFTNISCTDESKMTKYIQVHFPQDKVEVTGLKNSMSYSVRAQTCYNQEKCGNWSLATTVWTQIVGPQLEPVQLNKQRTTSDRIAIDLSEIEYSVNWTRYLIAKDRTSNPNARHGNETTILLKHYNESHWNETEVSKGFKIIRVSESETQYLYVTNPEAEVKFASAIIIHAGSSSKAIMSEYSEYFKAEKNFENWATLFGTLMMLLLSILLIIFIVKRYKFNKSLKEKENIKDHSSIKQNELNVPTSGFKPVQRPRIPNIRKTKPDLPTLKKPDQPNKINFNLDNKAIKKESNSQHFKDGGLRNEPTMKEYIKKLIDNFPEVDKIFKSVPTSMPGMNFSYATMDENRRKNRYTNNLPYDETRVMLPIIDDDPFSDYINANFVDAPFREKCFIATQGPKDSNVETISDFYRMIWLTQPSHIIMVANLVENGKKKVSQYWPDDETPVWFGNILVTLTSTYEKKNFLVRTLQLTCQDQEFEVIQYQFTTWPDHGVPTNTYRFSQLVQRLMGEMTYNYPIVVHCSAGIGRTGTLILLLIVLSQLGSDVNINFREILIMLRKGRSRLVENTPQFHFGLKLVFDYILCMEKNFSLDEYQNALPHLSMTITEEYKKLHNLRWSLKDYQFDVASNPKVADLNRNLYSLPADSNLVPLSSQDFSVTEQYINALRVSADDLEGYYITAEHPMAHTVLKIWQLIYEYEIPILVLANIFDPNDENFPILISADEPEQVFGDMKVTLIEDFHAIENNNTILVAQITISNYHEPTFFHSCTVIQLLDWQYGSELPDTKESVVYAANKICEYDGRPCLISCGDGITGCGLIATLTMILSYIKFGYPINIYKASVETIADRPEAIISEAQYRFLYDAIGYCIEAMKI